VLVTNHVLSGALVGVASPGPVSAFAAGVVSHFALDAVPHWGDVDFDEMVPVGVRDGLTGLAAMALLHAVTPRHRRWRVLAGMSGAAFPDLDKPSLLFFGRSPFPGRVDAFHARIQRESRDRMSQELWVGGGLLAAALVLVRARNDRTASP
jgi:hypothetical protein